MDERIEPFRNQRGSLNTLEHLEILRGVQERQVVPTLEAVVGPAGNGQKLVRRREVFRAHAEPRRHELADDLPVERVAGNGHAVIADNVFLGAAAPFHAGTDVQNRKIARAAAEIADQNQLILLQRPLVAVRRRNRLVLEHNLVKAALLDGFQQARQREPIVAVVLRVREMDRPPHDDAARHRRERARRFDEQVVDDERNHVLQRVPLRKHAGGVEAPIGEVRFERLNQPAFLLGAQVTLDGPRSRRRRDARGRCVACSFEIEDGRECACRAL